MCTRINLDGRQGEFESRGEFEIQKPYKLCAVNIDHQ